MPAYYELDSSRATLREYFWETKNPLVLLIAIIIKLFRIRLSGSTDDANVDSILECEVPEISEDLQARFAPLAAELAQLGFFDPVYHFIEDHGTGTRLTWATFRHSSGLHCARIHHRYWGKSKKTERGLFVLFITPFTDGTFLVSSAGKPDVAAPDSVQMNRMPHAATGKLWAEHERQVNASLLTKAIQPVADREQVVGITEALHIQQRDFHIARKFYRVRSAQEESNAAEFRTRVDEARAAGIEHPEIMAELTRLQEKKPKWTSALWVLGLSIVAFMAAGTAQWDWKITLWLIPILFIHELGHWVAMRLFKYRNLRMFFIPFFGAAVTGQNWNVPGWKKSLVSLAGPLPGMALGIALGIVGMIWEIPFLKQAALMLILINGFNLLPVLPLDGGHLLHATLFCRNRWLDIGFRFLAVLALLGMAAFGMGKLLMFIGIMLAIGLPVAFKMGKLIDRFRNEPLPPPTPGEDRIPVATAQVLISAVKQELPANSTNAIVAQHTLNVFETLNARPPNVLATISLLVLYGGSIIASAVCVLFLIISQQGGLGDFFNAAARQPEIAISCNQGQKWHGSEARQNLPVNILVTTFEEHEDARAQFENAKTVLPQTADLTLFGNSLLLKLPAEDDSAREEWFVKLQNLSSNTFVVVSNNVLTMSLNFIAPRAASATNFESELNNYFSLPGSQYLIPPWDPKAASAEFEKYRQARNVWKELTKEHTSIWSDPSLKKIEKQMVVASRRGSTKQVEKLEKEEAEQIKRLQADVRQRLTQKYESTEFAEVARLYVHLDQLNYTNKVDREEGFRQLARELGSIDQANTTKGFAGGSFSRSGLVLQAHWLTLHNPTENLPAILDWLCKEGCAGVKYGFHDSTFSEDDSDWGE